MRIRDRGVDVVRCLALFSMYLAHCAPVMGPAGLFELSEYLTMPLFALLVGVGADLGERAARVTGRRAWAASLAVRVATLLVVAQLLERAGAQILIVLTHLAVTALLAAGLARLPSVAVAATTVAVLVLAPPVTAALADEPARGLAQAAWDDRLLWFLAGGGPYRITSMLVYAGVGVLLARWALRSDPPRRAALVTGLALLGAVVVAAIGDARGAITLSPYSGTLAETLFNALLVAAVFLLTTTAVPELPGPLVAPLAWAGAMSLTLYSLQVVYLGWYVGRPGVVRDDSWLNVAVLVVGSLVLASAWHASVRRPPWSRGPLEGVVGALTVALGGRPIAVARPARSARRTR